MASEVLCGHCGALLTNPTAPCPGCGASASGSWQYSAVAQPKDPRIAALLAVIPGVGHFYLGHNLKGIGFLVGIVGFQLFDAGLDLSVIGLSVGVPLELGPGALWLYSIVDAYRTAKQGAQVRGPNVRY